MRKVLGIVASALVALFISACQTNVYYPNELDRFESLTAPSTVLLVYGVAHNNLASAIQANLNTLAGNKLPAPGSDQVVLSFCNFSRGDFNWQQETPTHLIRYSLFEGKVRRDTVMTVEAGRKAVDPEVMKEVLDYVKNRYKADRYGLIMSSHGSGWLPVGYVQSEENARHMRFHEFGESGIGTSSLAPARRLRALGGPATKTFGSEYYGVWNQTQKDADVYEMSVPRLAGALGSGWDFIVFDACFMGSVEVAYELRHCARMLCVSAAEVIAQGFNYRNMADLIFRRDLHPEDICLSFYNLYKGQPGASQTATIACVQTAGLDGLAETCKELISKYRTELDAADPNAIQLYSRGGSKWFYDLQDIFNHIGISQQDSLRLQSSLDACISYKAATPKILDEITVRHFCGLSMFLPAINDNVLSGYYRQLAWNKYVNLVEE